MTGAFLQVDLEGKTFVSQTEHVLLAHLSRRLTGELIVCLRCLSYVVSQHFQTSSPLKPLGRLKPNFMWSLHGMGERKFVQTVQVT